MCCLLYKSFVSNKLEIKLFGIKLFWLNILTKKQEWVENQQVYYTKNCKHRIMIILMLFYWKTLPEIWATRKSWYKPQWRSLQFEQFNFKKQTAYSPIYIFSNFFQLQLLECWDSESNRNTSLRDSNVVSNNFTTYLPLRISI